ncbi:MAG TPA: hypothetical protein VG309_04830, partial [Rhizomicrobium sp.]|nr:hypothetical protein [Rhizomicrobium sp.]
MLATLSPVIIVVLVVGALALIWFSKYRWHLYSVVAVVVVYSIVGCVYLSSQKRTVCIDIPTPKAHVIMAIDSEYFGGPIFAPVWVKGDAWVNARWPDLKPITANTIPATIGISGALTPTWPLTDRTHLTSRHMPAEMPGWTRYCAPNDRDVQYLMPDDARRSPFDKITCVSRVYSDKATCTELFRFRGMIISASIPRSQFEDYQALTTQITSLIDEFIRNGSRECRAA